MLNIIKNIYTSLPLSVKQVFRYAPHSFLFGFSYLNTKKNISFSKSILDRNLFNTLIYSRENTLYGKDTIPQNIDIKDVKYLIKELPIINSDDLSSNLNYYISKEYSYFNSYITTTGGTGRNPTSILLSNKSFGAEWAHIHYCWAYANYNKAKDMKLTLRGKHLSGDKFIEYNPIYNELVIDTFKVSSINFRKVLEKLNQWDYGYIHGYPSLIKEFIEYFKKYNYRPRIKGILIGSESATIEEKKYFSDYFKCRVIHWYGQSERCLLAVDLDSSDQFKVFTSYGYPQVINDEIVATTFINNALPLINYKIGDSARLFEFDDRYFLSKIKSRWGKDFIYLNENKKISTTAINIHDKIQSEIQFYQLVQRKFGEIEIKIVIKSSTRYDDLTILNKFTKIMKNNLREFKLSFEIVGSKRIIRSHRGKMIFLVQHIKID
jgi:phenylacetate-CoA ligase